MPVDSKQFEDLNLAAQTEMSLMDKINGYLLKISRVPLKEKLFFLQHLGIMLKAGISLSQALNTLALQSSNKYFQFVLKDVAKMVDGGNSFTESLKKYEKVFGELFINMIEAGELSGKLEEVLKQLFIQTKKSYELKSKIKSALTYPVIVLVAMGGIGTFMMVFIVPRITSMLIEFDTELPMSTKILIAVSNAVANNIVVAGLSLFVFIVVMAKILKTKPGKLAFQGALLWIPIISPIIKKINIAQFSRTISSLLKTDIMIIKTFQITGNVLGNLYYRRSLEDMADKIKKGGKIAEVITSYPRLFPPLVAQMVMVGEETGELDNILSELAEFYEEEIDNIMTNLPSIIEPVLILLLGIGVGGIVVSIIMPMYSITNNI